MLAAGVAQAGAHVRLYLGQDSERHGLWIAERHVAWRLLSEGTTDSKGVAHLDAEGPGHYLIVARATGFAPGARELPRPSGEKLTHALIELQRGITLVGVTRMRQGHQPVPLAQLTLTPDIRAEPSTSSLIPDVPGDEQGHAVSDRSGVFRIENLAPGRYRIDADAPGSGRARLSGVQLPRGKSLLIDLSASAFLEGHVLGADRAPAAGAEVLASSHSSSERATSTDSGAFSLEVAPGAWALSGRRSDQVGTIAKSVLVAEGQTLGGLEVRLGAASFIEGTIVQKSDRTPITGALVVFTREDLDGDAMSTISDESGHFSAGPMVSGSYQAQVSHEGFVRSERRGVSVLAGQHFQLRVEMQATGAIVGTVRDSHGGSIAGALLEVVSKMGAPNPLARSNPDGTYRLAEVAAGSIRVSARREGTTGETLRNVEVKSGQTVQLDFSLEEEGQLRGRVAVKGGGALPPGVVVRDAQSGTVTVAPDGSYQMDLPLGSHNVFAAMPGGELEGAHVPVTIESGQTSTQDLELPDSTQIALSVQVLEPGGAPSANANALVFNVSSPSAAGFFFTTLLTDGSGQASLFGMRSLLADKLEISASNGGRTGRAQAGPGETSVVVQLGAAGSLSGDVVSNAPVEGFTLNIKNANSPSAASQALFATELEFSGAHFEASDLPPQPLHLRALTSDGRIGEADATPGTHGTPIEIELLAGASIIGRVVDGSGAPVPGARVLLDLLFANQSTSGADGRFQMASVAPGAHSIFINAGRSGSTRRTTTAQAGEQTDLGDVVLVPPKAGPGAH